MEGGLALGLALSPHIVARLVLYLKEMQRWNQRMNLTSLEDELDIVSKHFLDSLAALKLFDPRPGLRLLDVGTGAGFPGLVLKIQAPALAVTLLEPSTKKAAFLHHVMGLLGISGVKILTARLEDFTDKTPYDLVTTRAVKAEVILGEAPRLLAPGGRVLLYRASPLETAPQGFAIANQVSFQLPFVGAPRALCLLRRSTDTASSEFTTLLIHPSSS